MFFNKNSFGFTLAEVLITLGIIGVVAAVVIPVVINNYQKNEYVSKLKKFYSTAQQSVMLLKQDTGCETSECMGFAGAVSNSDWNNQMEDSVKKIFKTLSICKYGDTSCTGHKVCGLDGISNCSVTFGADQFSFETIDGMNVRINPQTAGAAWFPWTLDVNGDKKPNIIGRDVHLFRMDKSGVIHPYYGYYYASHVNPTFTAHTYWKTNINLCNPALTTGSTGYGCTARVIESGWQMDY